jgi:hypothetical protein
MYKSILNLADQFLHLLHFFFFFSGFFFLLLGLQNPNAGLFILVITATHPLPVIPEQYLLFATHSGDITN